MTLDESPLLEVLESLKAAEVAHRELGVHHPEAIRARSCSIRLQSASCCGSCWARKTSPP